jgi:putative glutamine amidotransferase
VARPVIGLSTYREMAAWTVWNLHADLLPGVYTRSMEAAGAVVVLLPPQSDGAAEIMARLDGLIITGGPDVDPERYGERPHARTVRVREDRDAWEIALLTAAAEVGLPVLGVCRGMQLMAVTAGGSLLQHIPDVTGSDRHSPGPDIYGAIEVRTEPGSRLAGIIGDAVTVACHHHQAVVDHPGFVAVATADDGLLEAMETPGDRFRLGVQWHPETQADRRLFEAIAAAAIQWRHGR